MKADYTDGQYKQSWVSLLRILTTPVSTVLYE